MDTVRFPVVVSTFGVLLALAVGGPATAALADPAATLAVTIDPVTAFSPLNTVQLSGSKDAGSTIVIQPIAPSSTSPCLSVVDSGTSWNCTAAVPNGADITITAVETSGNDTASATSNTFDVLGPPTITGQSGLLTTGLISGAGYPGSTVIASVSGLAGGGCTSGVDTSGYWSCALAAPSGDWSVTATQSRADLGAGHPSSVSGSLDVVVDKDAPAPPVITFPRAQSRVSTGTVTYRGTGENAGTVDVYVDSVPVCSSIVTGTVWSCTAPAPRSGTHAILGVQRDAAGNFSAPSAPITLIFGAAPPVAAPSPAPSTPAPSASAPTPVPAPTIPPFDTKPPATPPHTGWDTPTTFGASMPTLASSVIGGNWLFAPLIALVFIALVAFPLRLLALSLAGRTRRSRPRFTGRNQLTSEPELRAPANPWLAGIAPLAVATALVVISSGVNDELRYLRLALAVAVGLAALNLVGVALPARLAGRRLGIPGRLRFVVLMLVAAALAAVLSRVTGIHPPVVAGVLIGTVFAAGLPARPRALVRLTEVAAVTVLGLLAWVGHGLLAGTTGFVPVASRELLATIALAGLGSAVVMVLPIGSLPGRVLLEWSWRTWLASTFVVVGLASVVFLGASITTFPALASLLVAAAFAAVSLAVWGWIRFVGPSLVR